MTLLKLRVTLLDVMELNSGGDEVTKYFDSIQNAGNGHLNGATMDFASFSTTLQAIFTEGADYTK